MRRLSLFIVFIAACLPAAAQGNGQGNGSMNGKTELNLPDPPMLGQHLAKDAQGGAGPFQSPKSPNLTYRGGGVLTSPAVVKAIFWGAKWGDSAFVGDKVTGLNSWYSGVGNSNYAGTNTEYTNSTATHVIAGVSYSGYLVDTSDAPSRAPSTSAILNKVCSSVTPDPSGNGYYPVYVDTPRRNANYCAWHSWGSCNGIPVQFGFFFNLDGDSGCDPEDASGLHSQGLAALANVTGHELSETMTDPRGSGWLDSQGAENADKCAWSFSGNLVRFSGSQWKIQGNWSNAAYNAGGGYANRSGQKGCIDGN